jgi:membrane protein YqaA with SNARE-associated domain
MSALIQAIYDHIIRAAAHKYAMWYLGAVAFVESSFFPIPVDAMLFPMVLAKREKAWRMAFVCTVCSVAGGVFGYAIGLFFYDTLGRPLLEFYGYLGKFEEFAVHYNEWGAWIVFGAGLTPFPYKVITIASGVTQLDLLVFVVASAVARGMRFYAVAWLCWYFGPAFRQLIERNLALWTTILFMFLIGGFLAIKWLL